MVCRRAGFETLCIKNLCRAYSHLPQQVPVIQMNSWGNGLDAVTKVAVLSQVTNSAMTYSGREAPTSWTRLKTL